MSRELVYTSAPRGVRPGSQGFCTVAHTQGMPANLIQQLESLSGYRQIYPPQDSKASLNPVVFSHLVLTLAGRRCHVLSRICDAGLDYTQRTNKFAHHVVLDAAEVPVAGPAWLLAQPKFMQSKWTGEPEVLLTGPVLPSGESKPRVCRTWQQIAGDAGWAGVLAETATGPSSRQAVIIFQPGVEMLPLLVEALALLPAELRWRISFSTYFTKLPAGVGCQWRCVVDGTPEAIAARRSPQAAVVIDLCRPLGGAVGGAYVEAARTGKKPATATTAEQLSDTELEYALQQAGRPPIHAGAGLPVPTDAEVPYCDVAPPPVSSRWNRPPRRQLLHPTRKPAPRWPWLLVTAALIFIVIGVGVLAWTVRFGTDKTTKAPQDKANVAATVGKNNGKPNAAKDKETKDAKAEEDKNKAEAERVAAEKKNASDKATVAASAADQAAKLGKSVTAEGKRIAGETKRAAQAAKNVGADVIAKQAESAAIEVINAVDVVDKAADKATQAARKAEQAIKASSSAADIVNAAQDAERDAASAQTAAGNARNTIEAARVAADDARKAVGRKTALEKPLALPPCDSDPTRAGAPLPTPFEITQLVGISTREIAILGLADVFQNLGSPTSNQRGQSRDFYFSTSPTVPPQPIAHLTVEKNGNLKFYWDDRAKGEKEKVDLLRNCLLCADVADYSTPAIIRLRQAKPANPLPFSLLARGETEESQSVDLDSVPPNKEIGFRLLDFPQGWKVEPGKDKQGQERHDAYAITVSGDVPLHFDCSVKVDDAKRLKPERHNGKRFDKRLKAVLTYIGAGYPPQVIYQRDKDKKCNELQHDLDALGEELQALTKDEKKRDDSQPAHEKNKDEEPIVGLKRGTERLQREIEAVKALPKEKGEQLGKLKERTDQLHSKIVQLDLTMKSLATFESNQPVLHYCLFIKVADKGTDYELELLRTERPPHVQ